MKLMYMGPEDERIVDRHDLGAPDSDTQDVLVWKKGETIHEVSEEEATILKGSSGSWAVVTVEEISTTEDQSVDASSESSDQPDKPQVASETSSKKGKSA